MDILFNDDQNAKVLSCHNFHSETQKNLIPHEKTCPRHRH